MITPLVEVLFDPKTADNTQRMFEIGTERMHESAFAVHKKDETFEISDLYVPEIEKTDVLDPETLIQHTTIDFSSLIVVSLPSEQQKVDFEIKIIDASKDLCTLSERTQKGINTIRALFDYTEEEKETLVRKLIAKELKHQEPTIVYRDDIIFESHNHPLTHDNYFPSLDNLLIPSNYDVENWANLQKINPALISQIVASTKKEQGAILVARNPKKLQITSNYWEAETWTQTLQTIRDIGFMSIFIDLRPNGLPKNRQIEKIQRFATRTNYAS